MSVLVGFAGLFVGWLLGFGTQMWTERRDARDAAQLIAAELRANLNRLGAMRKTKRYAGDILLHDRAWQTYGVLLLRIAPAQSVQVMTSAYESVSLGNEIISAIGEVHETRVEVARLEGKPKESVDVPSASHLATMDSLTRPLMVALGIAESLAALRGFSLLSPRAGRATQGQADALNA